MIKFTDAQIRIIFCTLFLLSGLALFSIYKYQINPDGIAYLSIARHYSEGRWMDALNSCWPPMLSWLLAPWFNITDEPLWVFKIYNIMAGAGCLWVSHLIMKHYQLQRVYVVAGLLFLSAYFMMWAYWVTSPDLISTWLILLYGYWVLNGKIFRAPAQAALLGVLAYLVKSYCFFFFVAHLSFHYVYSWYLGKLPVQLLLRKYAWTMLLFMGLCSCWMGLLSLKYHTFSVSSASGWTHGMLKYPNLACMEKFLPPPNEKAVFAWEDPPLVCQYQDWSLFESTENLRLQWDVIWRNTKHLIGVLQKDSWYFHVAGFLLILMAILMETGNKQWRIKTFKQMLDDPLFPLLPLILIYTFGYLLIFIEPRYVWMGYVLITIGSFVAIQQLTLRWRKLSLMVLLPLVALPLVFVLVTLARYPKMITPLKAVITQNKSEYNGYRFYYSCYLLKQQMKPEMHMACLGNNDAADRTQSWTIAYYNRLHHYGILPADTSEARKLIKEFNISVITLPINDSLLAPLAIPGWKRIYPDAGNQSVYLSPSAFP